MPKNNKPVIIGAAILGVLAIGLTLMLLMGGPAPAPAPGGPNGAEQPLEEKKAMLFTARNDIPPRTELKAAMFISQEINEKDAPAGALTNLDDVEGKVSSAPIRRGQVVTSALTVEPIARVIPANMAIPVGSRAVALWVNPSETVAGLVDVGDRVDVIVNHALTLEKTETTQVVGATEFVSGRTIAQDLQVLAVDRSISAAAEVRPTPPPNQPGQPGLPEGQQPAPTPTPIPPAQQANPRIRVVVAASPVDAERIVAANQNGTVHLTLRNPASRERFPIPEAREYPSRLVSAPKKPAAEPSGRSTNVASDRPSLPMPSPNIQPPMPNPLPPASINQTAPVAPNKEVTVIRGTEKTRVLIPN